MRAIQARDSPPDAVPWRSDRVRGLPRMAEALDVYERAAFEITGLFPVSREADSGRVPEFDSVMVRPSALPGAR